MTSKLILLLLATLFAANVGAVLKGSDPEQGFVLVDDKPALMFERTRPSMDFSPAQGTVSVKDCGDSNCEPGTGSECTSVATLPGRANSLNQLADNCEYNERGVQ